LIFQKAMFSRDIALKFGLGLIATPIFVLLTWVPFRAENFSDVMTIWSAFTGLREGGSLGISAWVWLTLPLIAFDALLGRGALKRLRLMPALRAPLLYWGSFGALSGILLALYPLDAAPFVYFQF